MFPSLVFYKCKKMLFPLIFILLSITDTYGWTDTRQRRFRDNFLFGAGTSAYQVEGGWDADGKGKSIWDVHVHNNPDVIVDGTTGDVASDSYHNYVRDVEMLRELGVNHYRFSISWPRILPTGQVNKINEKGIEYYNKLIDELLKYDIQPVITLYHFDLPKILQDLGGWANPLSIQWFEDYANVVFNQYADRVKYWVTINQPNTLCVDGYTGTDFAPAVDSDGVGVYMCVKNVLLAHARAYKLYEKEYKQKYKGSVGLAVALNWADSIDNKTENVEATALYREFTIGLYMNPIWSKDGDFPKDVKKRILEKSLQQGFKKSRLPDLSSEEIKLLKGSADFVGVNHYTTTLVKRSDKEYRVPSVDDDMGVEFSYRKEWKTAHSTWLKSVPYGLYKMFLHLNSKYDYPATFITENGWSSTRGLNDSSRVEHMRNYLKALLLAIEDGADVIGYTAWSLMDNFEWLAGESERFGLYEVDFNSEEKKRTARLSAVVYKRIIEMRILEENWEPKNLNISITKKAKTRVDL